MIKILFIALLLINTSSVYATVVFKANSGGGVSIAKEFSSSNGIGYIIVNPRNFNRYSISDGASSVSWQSKYGSLTFNQYSSSMPIGGVNEKGLLVEMIPSNEMQMSDEDKMITLNEFELVQYLLDNCKDIAEATNAISRVRVSLFFDNFHLFLADRSGLSAVVEYIDEAIVVTDNSSDNYSPVLSGKLYSKNSAMTGRVSRLNEGSLDPFETLKQLSTANTKWCAVYDLSHNKVMFQTKDYLITKSVNLSDINFSTSKLYYIDINQLLPADVKGEFRELTRDVDHNLMLNSFIKSPAIGFSKELINTLAYGTHTQKRNAINGVYGSLSTLKVEVSGLDNDKGVLRLSLYNDRKGFDNGDVLRTQSIYLKNSRAVAYFYNVQTDVDYAVFFHHDTNSNNKLDRQWVGLPKEDYGYSGKNGRNFDNAKFRFVKKSKEIHQIKKGKFLFW